MTDQSSARAYRETEILAASPGRLVVITFDGLLAALTRARAGMNARKPDISLPALARSREFLGELLAALDRKEGGDLAAKLGNVYVFVLTELQALGQHPDIARLDTSIALIRELRDAFATIEAAGHPAARVAVA